MSKGPRPELVKAYKLTFAENEGTKLVLGDLAMFCMVQASTAQVNGQGAIDPFAMAINEGRRQVMQRITAMTEVDMGAIWSLAQREREQAAHHLMTKGKQDG